MSQNDFENEVARVTGENRHTIRCRGFQLVNFEPKVFDPEPDQTEGQYYDWDSHQSESLTRVA